MKERLPLAHLRRLLDYDVDTGSFTWKVDRNFRMRAGSRAGTDRDGYVHIMIDRRLYSAARLAWYYITGAEPTEDVGFVNGDASDLRFVNLKQLDRPLLQLVKQEWCLDAGRGYLVERRANGTKRYRAHVWADGRSQYLGTFGTAQGAQSTYWFAKLFVRLAG